MLLFLVVDVLATRPGWRPTRIGFTYYDSRTAEAVFLLFYRSVHSLGDSLRHQVTLAFAIVRRLNRHTATLNEATMVTSMQNVHLVL